jgi:hypothetical protein
MGAEDREPNPRRQVPTLLWVMLGCVLVVVFVAAVFVVGRGHPKTVGPSAGSPPVGQPGSLAH